MYLSFSSPLGCSVEGSPEQIICLSLTLSLASYHVILSMSSIFTCMYMHAYMLYMWPPYFTPA